MTNPTPIEAFRERLRTFSDSEQHSYNCTAHDEGQACCIDTESKNYESIIAAAREYGRALVEEELNAVYKCEPTGAAAQLSGRQWYREYIVNRLAHYRKENK